MRGTGSYGSDQHLIATRATNVQAKDNVKAWNDPVLTRVTMFIVLLVVIKGLIQLTFQLYVIIGGYATYNSCI